jgi:hypothetical protein
MSARCKYSLSGLPAARPFHIKPGEAVLGPNAACPTYENRTIWLSREDSRSQ